MAAAKPSKGMLLSSNLSCNSVLSMEQLVSFNVPAFERGDARRHRDELNATLNQLPEQPKQDYSMLTLGQSLSALSTPGPLRERLYNELQDPCCTKKCLLWSAHDYPVQLLRLMEEAKDHADKRASHSAQSTKDSRTGFAPRPVSMSGGVSSVKNTRGIAATTLTSREKQQQRIFAALKSKSVFNDSLEQRRSTIDSKRIAFLEEVVPILLIDGKFCVKSVYRILSCTHGDLYGNPYGTLPLVDRVKARRRRLKGTRQERGLPALNTGTGGQTFEDDATNDCCSRSCSRRGRASNTKLWGVFEKDVQSLSDEVDFFMNYLWDQSIGRLSCVCRTHVQNLFGISPEMYYNVCSQLEAHSGERVQKIHGNSGRSPVNATSRDTILRFFEVIERNVMWDPTSPVAHFTGTGSTTPGLLGKFDEELPKAILDRCKRTTQQKLIQMWVDRNDLIGIKSNKQEHNYCIDCKRYWSKECRADAAAKRERARAAGGEGIFCSSSSSSSSGGGGGASAGAGAGAGAAGGAKSADEWDAEKEVAKAALEAHRSLHFELFIFRQKLKALAIAMLNEAAKEGFRAWKHNEPRQWNLLRILVVDDKSAAVYPSVVQSASSELYRFTSGLNGQADAVYEEMTAYVTDSTKSQKHTDSVIFEILMELLERGLGEKYLVLVYVVTFLKILVAPENSNIAVPSSPMTK